MCVLVGVLSRCHKEDETADWVGDVRVVTNAEGPSAKLSDTHWTTVGPTQRRCLGSRYRPRERSDDSGCPFPRNTERVVSDVRLHVH